MTPTPDLRSRRPTRSRPDPTCRAGSAWCASTHWVASAAAQAVLERGGNAFDAAVAGGFVLHVVEPHLNGPGGDLTGDLRDRRRPRADGPGRPGSRPGGRHHRALSGPRASTWSRARARSRRPSPARSTPGCCCCATTAPGSSPTCSPIAIDVRRGGPPDARPRRSTIAAVADLLPRPLADVGRPSGCPTASCPSPATWSRNEAYAATLRRGSSPPETGPATREARIDAARRGVGRAGSSPRRSTRSYAPRTATPRRPTTPA